MNIKPIRTHKDHKQALSRIDQLLDTVAGSPERDELEVLSLLVADYEDVHYPIAIPDPVDAIQARLEEEGLKQKDLVAMIGSEGVISEVMNRKRGLSLNMIRKLHEGLDIPYEILLKETVVAA